MPLVPPSRAGQPKKALTRQEQSDLLRRKTPAASRESSPVLPALRTASRSAAPADHPVPGTGIDRDVHDAPLASAPAAYIVIKKSKHLLTTEQTVQFNSGPGQPVVYARMRLTAAMIGQRRENGLKEAALGLRLEILDISAGATVEGISLGPWQANGLTLTKGSLWLSPERWTSFQPESGKAWGRLRLADGLRHRLLDLPWLAEIIQPGSDVI